MPTDTAMRIDGTDIRRLMRLQSWLSPAFPIGSYSYSHGVEGAIEEGLVSDAANLAAWIDGLLRYGTGRSDAILIGEAWRLAAARDWRALAGGADFAAALAPTAELRLETETQGAAFLRTVAAAWPDAVREVAPTLGGHAALPVAFGAVAAADGVPLGWAVPLYLQAFAANLVSAAVRAIPLGQSDGQRALAALEDAVEAVAAESETAGLDDIGTSAPMAEWSSLRHEVQDGRLFRS